MAAPVRRRSADSTPQYFNQGRQYNSLDQLTEIDTSTQASSGYPLSSASPGAATYFFARYTFSATANNGQITQMQDARTVKNTIARWNSS